MKQSQCQCHSGKEYEQCCKPFHDGGSAPTALALMRSRYCAYARHLPAYIIRTTHPNSVFYQADIRRWSQEILAFCQATDFEGLDILAVEECYVTFRAHLKQGARDVSFVEKSYFEKVGSEWRYLKGV